jgi:hypothetical protein
MKKRYILLALILAATPAFAARQTISPVAPSSSPADLRGKLNVELGKVDDNDVELYTDVAAKADYADVLQRWHSYPAGYTFYIDDLTMYGGKIYKAVTSHVKGGSNPLVDTANWQEFFVAGQGSNLAATAGASTITVTNDNGTGFTLPAATGSTAGVMTAADATKLGTIAASATANSADATLLARANHTGTQAASTISDFSTAVTGNATISAALSKLAGIQSGAQVNVKPDWNATPGAANEILNQPDVVATDQDFTVTADAVFEGEATFEDIILPLFDTAAFDAQNPEPTCSAGAYFIYFTATKQRQCINGTASDVGSGTGSMEWPGAGIANSTGSAWGTSYSVDSDLGDSTNLSTAFPTAAAVKTLVNGLSASAIPSYSATPADVADGVVWYNTTANELCVAESAGVSCVAMTYTADDNDPSNATPWFEDDTDIATGIQVISDSKEGDVKMVVDDLGVRGATISVTGSAGAGYSKNSAACTSTSGRVYEGDTVQACVTSSSSASTATTSTVTIGTDSDTYSVTTEAPSITYLVDQNFEGTGAPAGWTAASSSILYDSTSIPLSGSQSLQVLDGANASSPSFTAATDFYMTVKVRVDTFPGTSGNALRFTVNGSEASTAINILADGKIQLAASGKSVYSSAGAIAEDTDYDIRIRITTGSGDSIGQVDYKPTSSGTWTTGPGFTNGTVAYGVTRVNLRGMNTGGVINYDDLKVWDDN